MSTTDQTRPHDWTRSTLGHGESMCRRCFITNREAAVLGQLNHCPVPEVKTKEAFSVGEYIADEMKARGWTSDRAYKAGALFGAEQAATPSANCSRTEPVMTDTEAKSARSEATEARDVLDRMVERAARKYLDLRGLCYVETPEDGQDAYDLSREAYETMLAVLREAISDLVIVLRDTHELLGYYLNQLPGDLRDNRVWMRGYETLKSLDRQGSNGESLSPSDYY